jgi:hypothetical protein
MNAYKVICDKYYPGNIAYYHAETSSKARYLAFLTIIENHYNVKFGDIQVLRAPEFDKTAGAEPGE